MIDPKRAWIRRPGDQLRIRIDGIQYRMIVPDTYECLSIAAEYRWWDMVPGAFVDGDRDHIENLLLKKDSRISYHVLHYAAQSVGQLVYGWPMFSAAKIIATVRVGEPLFRIWCAGNGGMRPDDTWSAADWCAMAVAWFMAGQEKKEDRSMLMSQLQTPTTLSPWGPGVTPSWVLHQDQQ